MKFRGLALLLVLAGLALILVAAFPALATSGFLDQPPDATHVWDQQVRDHTRQLEDQGRAVFRYDTFGSEDFFGTTLGLHEAIEGAAFPGGVGPGVSPKLVLAGPATPRFKQTPTEPFGLDEPTAAATLEAIRRGFPETMAAFGGANFHRTDMGATRDWFLSMWLRQPAYAAYKYFKTLLEADLRDRLPLVDVPVLLVHGRHDQVCNPGWSEYMLRRLRDARLVWFDNSGHALMVEEPDTFSAVIANFVEDPDHVEGAVRQAADVHS